MTINTTTSTMQGFLIQARAVGSNVAIGSFTVPSTSVRTVDCGLGTDVRNSLYLTRLDHTEHKYSINKLIHLSGYSVIRTICFGTDKCKQRNFVQLKNSQTNLRIIYIICLYNLECSYTQRKVG